MNLQPAVESPASGDEANGEVRIAKTLGDLHKTITMAQIAKAAGVSQGAISSLLNDRDYGIRVSEKTRERVFKVCREMGYIPNDLRAVVRMYPELGDYCLLFSTGISDGLANAFVARVAMAVMAAMGDPSNPLTIGLYDEGTDYNAAPEALPQPIRTGVCSRFLVLGPPNASLLQALNRRGSPVISIGRDAAAPAVVSLIPDYAQASRLAIEQLYQLGHRHIGIVSGPFGAGEPYQLELNRGVKLACDRLGLVIEAHHIAYGGLDEPAGRHAFEEFYAHPSVPTGIFCMSDSAAFGVQSAAQARGLKIPSDLSVIGCADDTCAKSSGPALTTVHIPAEEMATLGVKEIDRLVREPLASEARKVLVPVHLITRKSTGPAPRSETASDSQAREFTLDGTRHMAEKNTP